MADSQPSSFSDKFKTWVQTVAIIIAAGWGIYAFVYKEVWVPKSAPVNITLDLALQKSIVSETKQNKNIQPLYAIEMKVAAKNPSSRTIYLLPNTFVVFGLNIDKDFNYSQNEYENFLENNVDKLENYFLGLISKHLPISNISIVVIGDLFADKCLKPGEQIAKSVIFHVPRGEYDMLQVFAYIPTCAKRTNKFTFKYYYNKKDGFTGELCRIAADGKFNPLKANEKGEYIDAPKDLEYQQLSGTSSMISLW